MEFEYIPNAIPYLGKDEARQAIQTLSESVIIMIMESYLDKGRSVTIENCFTSTHLSTHLLKKEDVTCQDSEQNLKGSCTTGKSFTAEQIIHQALVNQKRQKPNHNLDSLQVQTKQNVGVPSTLHTFVMVDTTTTKKQKQLHFTIKLNVVLLLLTR